RYANENWRAAPICRFFSSFDPCRRFPLSDSQTGKSLRNNETKCRFRRLGRLDLRDALGAKVELTGEFSTSASRRIVKMWPDCELRPKHLPNYSVIQVRLEAPSSTSQIGALPKNLSPLIIPIPAFRLASDLHIAR